MTLVYAQLEDITNEAVQGPSEYVSNGVLSSPWHGANVDGVRYFDQARVYTQNLLLQSENLAAGATWPSTGADTCVASNAGGVPFAGAAAFLFTENAGIHSHRISINPTVPNAFSVTLSAYFKAGTRDTCSIEINDAALANGARLTCTSLSAMTISAANYGNVSQSQTIVDVGNGWRLLTLRATFPSGLGSAPWLSLKSAPDFATYNGTGQTVYMSSPSFRPNSIAISDAYVPTTTAAVGPIDTGTYAPIPAATNLGYLCEEAENEHRAQQHDGWCCCWRDRLGWRATDQLVHWNVNDPA
jgi:hypothetical protein